MQEISYLDETSYKLYIINMCFGESLSQPLIFVYYNFRG
jgi:hypothetical protein